MDKKIWYIIFFSTFLSCNFSKDSSVEKGRVIARVYEQKLYQKDFEKLFPENISKEDSLDIAKELINSWAKEELLVLKSKLNMPSENEELEALVEKYKKDLFINSFKEALIRQKLDTVVTTEQIESYYGNNRESFKINEELLKFKYIQLEVGNKEKVKLKKLLISKGQNDLQLLDEEQGQFISSFLNDSIWVRYHDVLNKLPVLKSVRKESIIQPSRFIQKQDSTGLYYIYVNDVKLKNEIAPVRYISRIIKKMILHKRKLELVNRVENVLVDDAIKNKQFEIY